ncbi:hypothetical protein H0H92_001476 [Tricholoma furcatifolium]|nr:hypothetical protein H0H92_001476 [Tricholoma furcatifolium]
MQPTKNKGKQRTKVYRRSQCPSPPRTTNEDNDIDYLLARDMQRATLNSLATEFLRPTSESGPSQLSCYDDETVVVSSDEGLSDNSSDNFEYTDTRSSYTRLFAPAAEEGSRGNKHKRNKVYVVYQGRVPGIYTDWDACAEQVSGYSHNSFEGFLSLEEAQDAWNRSLARRTTQRPETPTARLGGLSQTPPRHVRRSPRAPASAARLANINAGLQMPNKVTAPTPVMRASHARLPDADIAATASPHSIEHQPKPVTDSRQPTQHIAPGLGEESQWYAVIEGQHPGVYHGRMAASRAVGHTSAGRVQIAASENDANKIFVKAFMARRVVRFE